LTRIKMDIARNAKRSFVAPVMSEVPLSADELLRALLSLPTHRRLSLLDSCGASHVDARYLIAGFDPFEIIEARDNHARIAVRGETEYVVEGDALSLLDERLAEYRVEYAPPEKLPAAGACIATLSFDLVHEIEHLRLKSAPLIADEPLLTLAFYDTLIVHDYLRGKTLVVGMAGPQRVAEVAESLIEAHGRAPLSTEAPLSGDAVIKSNLTRDEYLSKVRKIKEHIAAGDIYQANLTQQLTCTLSQGVTPEDVFLRLRRHHPAPYAAFIRRREDVVVSASPERFLRVESLKHGRRVDAWPIKGTRSRGKSIEEDERLRAELLMSEKDRAENIMIVDLLRNDLGRVCHYGSVEVSELCALVEHPTLFHLVSKVRGRLRDDATTAALLRAAFPCGSITGAPKIRAMEIIAEIETTPRGLSMGAIGYFSFDGSLDLSVAIRTMVVQGGVARFNVGGGVVADSSPELEYEESILKARALVSALAGQDLNSG
jgi:para-aminobenzoate synthetase component 1